MFDQYAPHTIRTAVVFLLILAIIDLCTELLRVWTTPYAEPGVYEGLVRPLLRFVVGLLFAFGIARMLGIFYWGSVILGAVVIPVLFITSLVRFYRSTDIGALSFGPVELLYALLWLSTLGLLLAPSSVRAFSKYGRLY